MPIQIEYLSDDFQPTAPIANGLAMLSTTWDELLWAALTVGRPNRQYIFRYGIPSLYEAIFRLSLIRMTIEQSGPNATRLRRTMAARTLDPSEKGAINYFLGLAICKLFAERMLNVPWLLHLDVFRPQLNPVLTGRSRPDLVGQSVTSGWISFECKGRVSAPTQNEKNKAKTQAQKIVSVSGAIPAFHVGAFTYFRNEVLQFYWCDPLPNSEGVKRLIDVKVSPSDWRYYYRPTLDLILSSPSYTRLMLEQPTLMPVPNADVEVGIHPAVLNRLLAEDWEGARHVAPGLQSGSLQISYKQDGIAVVAGESWSRRFDETESIARI